MSKKEHKKTGNNTKTTEKECVEKTQEVAEELKAEEVEKLESVESEIISPEESEKQIQELNEKFGRLMAEYSNFRKRTEKEKEELAVMANELLMNQLISVLDNFDRALVSSKEQADTPLFQGIEMVQKELLKILNGNGLKEIEAQDKHFDPNVHLAVMHEEMEGVEPDRVTEVFQKGYQLKGKVLRASMVKVSK